MIAEIHNPALVLSFRTDELPIDALER